MILVKHLFDLPIIINYEISNLLLFLFMAPIKLSKNNNKKGVI